MATASEAAAAPRNGGLEGRREREREREGASLVGDVDLLSLRCQRCGEATLLLGAGRPRLSSAPYKGCAGGADCPWALLFPSKTREEDGRLPPPSLPPSLRRFWPGCFPLLWVRGRGHSHRRGRRKQTPNGATAGETPLPMRMRGGEVRGWWPALLAPASFSCVILG